MELGINGCGAAPFRASILPRPGYCARETLPSKGRRPCGIEDLGTSHEDRAGAGGEQQIPADARILLHIMETTTDRSHGERVDDGEGFETRLDQERPCQLFKHTDRRARSGPTAVKRAFLIPVLGFCKPCRRLQPARSFVRRTQPRRLRAPRFSPCRPWLHPRPCRARRGDSDTGMRKPSC